ncbi:MAG: MFS transporter [Chloroflexi bacterium]|nr:MFS transporter [Chloroflexota bacterium]
MFAGKTPIYVLAFLASMGYGIILPGLIIQAKQMGSSYSLIGLMVSVYAAAQLATQIPVGRLSDRMGRKPLVVAGFAGVTLAALAYNFAADPRYYIGLQAFAGLSVGCIWAPLLARLTEQTEPAKRGKVMGIFNTLHFVGVGLGPLAGGYVALTSFSVFNLWAMFAGTGIVFSFWAFSDGPRAAGAAGGAGLRKPSGPMVKEGTLLSFVSACAIRSRGGFCTSFNNAILPLYAVALFTIPTSMVGGLMAIHGVMLAIFNFPGGVVADRVGRKWPAITGSLVATVGVLWYSFPGGYWPLFVAVGLAGAGAAFTTPALQALIGDIAQPARRGEAFSYFLTSFYIGTVFGASLFGFLADVVGLRWAVLSWGGFSLALSLSGGLIKDSIARPAPAPVASH